MILFSRKQELKKDKIKQTQNNPQNNPQNNSQNNSRNNSRNNSEFVDSRANEITFSSVKKRLSDDDQEISKIISLKNCFKQLDFLLKFYSHFYYRYILDNRTRIYTSAVILSYQLNKFVRFIIEPVQNKCPYLIFRQFFELNIVYLKYKIFTFQRLDKEKFLWFIQFFDSPYLKFENAMNILNTNVLTLDFLLNNLTSFVQLEQFATLIYRLGSLDGKRDLTGITQNGVALFLKIIQNDDHCNTLSSYFANEKNFNERFILFKNIKYFFVNKNE